MLELLGHTANFELRTMNLCFDATEICREEVDPSRIWTFRQRKQVHHIGVREFDQIGLASYSHHPNGQVLRFRQRRRNMDKHSISQCEFGQRRFRHVGSLGGEHFSTQSQGTVVATTPLYGADDALATALTSPRDIAKRIASCAAVVEAVLEEAVLCAPVTGSKLTRPLATLISPNQPGFRYPFPRT